MKICACITEYNPFHLGHLKHLEYIKKTLGAEKLIVIMSGNFCQRGEPAILNKFTRAKHAILAGADVVIELPTVFATANAEVFAKGGVKVINGLNVVDGLCFGVESGKKQEYVSLATAMNNESKEFKRALKENLANGVSLAKAKFNAIKSGEHDEELISLPNNILGLEYTKATLLYDNPVEIYPMIRTGDHNDGVLKKGVTSATSIRSAVKSGLAKKTKGNLPPFVFEDIKNCVYPFGFEKMILAHAITTPAEQMAKVPDCTEGLENRIKALCKDNKTLDGLIEKVSTKRYSSARVRRILIANMLGITKDFTDECLKEPLYAKVLAVKKESMDLLSVIAEKSSVPLLTRKSDCDKLKKTAKNCFEIDVLANDLYNLATGGKANENHMLII
ncbi:MAG: nucleotidyltransferase family protein [Clostridia bacterium]|nr:nucleotidyltransferase family protein [Clostridia bacterium]